MHRLSRIWRDEAGATTLEWALLLAVMGLPAMYAIRYSITTLVEYYRMMTLVNSLPFP